jgi:starch phosphorylase
MEFQQKWTEIKHHNKIQLANYVRDKLCIEVNPNSIFDCQIKRFHEYKRQLLNLLHVITLYQRLKNSKDVTVPHAVFFSGKAAPSTTWLNNH